GANRIALGVSPANGNYVYALAGPNNGTGAFRGIFRSTNSGVTWTTRTTTPNILGYSSTGNDSKNQSWYDLALAVSPTDINRLYTGGVNVWTSTNGGATMSIQSYWIEGSSGFQYTHADIHELVYNGNVLYCGSDGGVYRKANTGTNWADISSGLAITEFYRFGGTPQNANLYVGGAQDNGSNKIEGPIPDLQMEHIYGADGMEAAIDPTNVNTVFYAYQGGSMRRSTTGGNNATNIKPTNLGFGNWVTPYVLDPNNSNRILAGFTNVGISPSQGVPTSSYVNLSSGAIGGGGCVALAFAPSNSNYIYVVKSSAVYKTTNGGTNWTNITTGLPGSSYTYVAVSPTDPNRIYVTRSGWTANSKVFLSTNGGTTWTNYSGTGLPNVPANCIVYESGSDNGVYIGTDAGVYYRDDNETDWVDFSNGLPYCRVMEMEINPLANRLRAATFGRSIWESDLFGEACPDDLVLTGPLSGTQRIEANNTITSTNTINSGANITFSAGIRITLNPGFSTVSGSTFNAVMEGCTSMKNDASPVTGTYEPPLTPAEAGPVVQIEGYEITNYPNPFRDRTWISYRLPNDAPVMIEIFNMAAQRLAVLVDQKDAKAGMHTIPFDASELPAGQYFVRFSSGNHMSYHQLSRMR
ncbi:MAG TPA: T9SS type A sorting domain-containing protein, partial [Bacteroidetes bacterium]|nr:T9SS type A sorting domain-containing protein [Bacteroidota bacterium]